jgi:hypothetical protein
MWNAGFQERIMTLRAMKVLAAAVLLGVSFGGAQFKSQVEQESRISGNIANQSAPSFLFGWFDPEKFHMRHTFDLSYQSFGGQGLSLGTYTNSMTYEFAQNLDARADVSLSYSPFNSFSTFGGTKKNDLSSLYLSRAQLNYRPWENVMVQIQYRQIPYGSYYYSPFSNPWYRETGF